LYKEKNFVKRGKYKMTERNVDLERVALVTEIVAAYVSNNRMTPSDLPEFIQLVHRSLCNIEHNVPPFPSTRGEPFIPIEDSIKPDYIVCLEDGKRMKMLKRHLKTTYNMTPEQYKERWGLPSDYPMVAPNYAQQRSHLAKSFGLGISKKDSKKAAA
jgi:predicted transcriptional regulator